MEKFGSENILFKQKSYIRRKRNVKQLSFTLCTYKLIIPNGMIAVANTES